MVLVGLAEALNVALPLLDSRSITTPTTPATMTTNAPESRVSGR